MEIFINLFCLSYIFNIVLFIAENCKIQIRGQQAFSVKDQIVNILVFADHMVSVIFFFSNRFKNVKPFLPRRL